MKDIARDLGLSVVTVSKVLRNHPDISPATRKRVLQRAKELNYQPNLAARALATGRTNLIGLIVPDLVHPFFAQVAQGLSTKLSGHEYSLIISSSEENPALERRQIDQMISRRVDALILTTVQSDFGSIQRLKDGGFPFVLLDRKFPGVTANFVGIDDIMAGKLATTHLIEIGCKTIAYIGGRDISTANDRQLGYSMAMAKHNLSLGMDYILKQERGDVSGGAVGYECMKQLLRLNPRPDGVFCANDPIAIGAMRAILEVGLRIPQDIALIGCGNLHFDDVLRVPLSSVDQDSEGLGANAAKLALMILKKKFGLAPKTVLLPSTLVVRASTKR